MKRKQVLFTLILVFACFFAVNMKTQAARQKLQVNITYTRKLTGTANYKVRYTQPKANRYYKDLKLFVNGKAVKYISGIKYEALSYDVYLCTVATNRTLIAIRPQCDSGLMPFMNLYEYKNGKLNFIVNFCSLTRNTSYDKAACVLTPWARCDDVRSAGSNKIVLTWTDQTVVTGNIRMNIAYTISGTKVSKVGVSSELRNLKDMNNPVWTANRNFYGKSAPASGSVTLKVAEGDKVKLKAVTVRGGQRYIYMVAEDGSAGWVYVAKYADTDPMKKVDSEGNIIFGYLKECRFIG